MSQPPPTFPGIRLSAARYLATNRWSGSANVRENRRGGQQSITLSTSPFREIAAPRRLQPAPTPGIQVVRLNGFGTNVRDFIADREPDGGHLKARIREGECTTGI